MNHATVRVSGYVIPLIGLPPGATQCECDLCHEICQLQDLHLNEGGNQFLCPKHRDNPRSPIAKNETHH